MKSSMRFKSFMLAAAVVFFSGLCTTTSFAQFTANSLEELRIFSGFADNATVSLNPAGGDPHPVTGVFTAGEYWINGDHIANPTNSHPQFLVLGGTGNTYNFAGTTIYLDTRKLDGFGRNLGHDSGVDVVRIEGSDNLVQDLTLIGQDIALNTDPNAQRYADWAAVYLEMSGNNNRVDGANITTRGSRTDAYGLGDAFGKGASGGITPFLGHRKASAFRVGEATNAVVNDMHLSVNTFGHGFFVQQSTNTTLTNSTVTGELFSSQGVIDHPLYQQFGVTYHQNEIPDDILISGAEGGVRMYTGSSGLTVDGVVVTDMRTGFATSLGGGTKTLNNVEAYGVESAFDVGNDTTITNGKADGVNGPVLVVDRDIRRTSSAQIELVGDQPFNHPYALIYVNGNEIDVDLTSERPAEDFDGVSVFRTAQFFYDNWRENNGTTTFDVPGYDHFDSVLINDTQGFLVLGEQAEGNVGRSQGGVIGNGKENYYDGVTYVLSGDWLQVVHVQGLGNSGSETGAEFIGGGIVFTGTATEDTLDDNGTVVQTDATLELQSGIRIVDEKLTISGDGIDGLGALYTAGTGARFGSSSNSDESTIVLDGDASIGVGAGGDLLVGRVQGIGDLTKVGAGKLGLEKSNTFTGDLVVAGGEVSVRSNSVRYGFAVNAGASISPLGDNGYNTAEVAEIDGTLDLNGRSNDASLSQRVGGLSGDGSVVSSNPTAGSGATLEIVGDDADGVFSGSFDDLINVDKSGDNNQTLAGFMSHAGTTTVTGGGLYIDGTHAGGGAYSVIGATLGGSGAIQSDVTVSQGSVLDAGSVDGRGTLDIGGNYAQTADSTFAVELENASSYDSLAVFGAALLAGDIQLTSLDPAQYNFGDTVTLIASSNVSGIFAMVDGVSVGNVNGLGAGLAVTYGAQGVTARVSILGDVNRNGTVDVLGDAFPLISNLMLSSGATWSDGDFNGDGIVDVLGDAFSLISNLGASEGG